MLFAIAPEWHINTFPAADAPYLILVGRLAVVGEEGGRESAAGPAELDPLLGLPSPEDRIEQSAHETVAAAYAVEHMDLAGFHHMPGVAFEHDGAPVVAVGVVDLTQRGGEHLRGGILLLHAAYHLLESVDLGRDVLASGLGAFDSQAELEVLLVADKDVGDAAYLREDVVQLLLAADPEGGAVVEVEADARAVLLRGARDFEAEAAGLGAQGRDES